MQSSYLQIILYNLQVACCHYGAVRLGDRHCNCILTTVSKVFFLPWCSSFWPEIFYWFSSLLQKWTDSENLFPCRPTKYYNSKPHDIAVQFSRSRHFASFSVRPIYIFRFCVYFHHFTALLLSLKLARQDMMPVCTDLADQSVCIFFSVAAMEGGFTVQRLRSWSHSKDKNLSSNKLLLTPGQCENLKHVFPPGMKEIQWERETLNISGRGLHLEDRQMLS